MRILPGSSLETPEVGCEVLKRGHVVFSIKQCANTMILFDFWISVIMKCFIGSIRAYRPIQFALFR